MQHHSAHTDHTFLYGNMGHMHHGKDLKRRFIISMIVTIPILILSPMIQQWFGFHLAFSYSPLVVFLLSTFIYLYGGWPFLSMMVHELRSRQPGMMTLISMAISVAYFASTVALFKTQGKSFFWELATLIDIMLLGHYIEAKSIMATSGVLEDLLELIPKKATRLEDGEFKEVTIDQLQIGDTVLIHPGENIPADGIVLVGSSMVNEALLTGESNPIQKLPDMPVFMGSTNMDGSLNIRITKSGEQSYLSGIIQLVKSLQASRSHTQNLANRAAGWLFYAALSVGGVTFLIWSILSSFENAIFKMVTVLIIACPHALGLAVPLVVAISTSIAAKNGILIRHREAFEHLHQIDIVCFDKTGTLTEGKLTVSEVAGTKEEKELLHLAASMEQYSEHSIAQAIVSYAKHKGILLSNADHFNAIPGVGAQASIDGHTILIGGSQLLVQKSLQIPPKLLSYKGKGNTKVWVAVDNEVCGVILLKDTIREHSAQAIGLIRAKGIETYMLTGDNEAVASEIAKQTRIDHYESGLLPDEKLQKIRSLRKNGKTVAMVGDGINDAPALLEANIGIAIGAGTDIAIESADIILTQSDLLSVVDAIDLSKKTYTKMIQNLWWASGYNLIAIPLAAGALAKWGIIIDPAAGAILMSLSTIIVAFNAQLLKRQINQRGEPV